MKKVCANCNHWYQNKVGTWGGCVVISGLLDVNMEEAIYNTDNGDEICTPWAFGCNQWEVREND